MPNVGFDLQDGMDRLVDLRFLDDILLFAKSAAEASAILDGLVHELAAVGLVLNAAKTVVLTTQAQPPQVALVPGC